MARAHDFWQAAEEMFDLCVASSTHRRIATSGLAPALLVCVRTVAAAREPRARRWRTSTVTPIARPRWRSPTGRRNDAPWPSLVRGACGPPGGFRCSPSRHRGRRRRARRGRRRGVSRRTVVVTPAGKDPLETDACARRPGGQRWRWCWSATAPRRDGWSAPRPERARQARSGTRARWCRRCERAACRRT